MKQQDRNKKVPAEFAKSRIRVEKRQDEADKRAEKRSKLTPKQQLNRLDKKLGKGKGAIRERARLVKQLDQ
jgi:hypothetical protein